MRVVKGQGHTVSPVFLLIYFFSFHINQTNNSWDTAISKCVLETSKVKVMRSKVKVTYCTQYPTDAHPFCFASIGRTIREIWPKWCLTLKKTSKNSFQQNFLKFNQVIIMTRAIKLPCFIVTGWVVLTSAYNLLTHKGPVTRKMFPFDDVIMNDTTTEI